MVNKKLGRKKLKASVALGDELIVPYTESEVFSEFDNDTGELYILIKNTKSGKSMKLFFKDDDKAEIIDDKPKENE